MIAYGTDYPDALAPVPAVQGAVTVRLADVVPEHVSWLWPGRFPLGKIVVLDGDPSVGKSTTAVDCAARVSTGSPWPDGAANRHGAVLLLSAEDGLADTIRPRLDAAGGDPRNVHALTEVRYLDEDNVQRTRPVTLADIDQIEKAVRKISALLVVVDVLMAFLPSKVDSHRDQDIRGVLAGLAAMAERTGSCVLLLRHLNKAAGGSAMYRGGGSIGIIGAARVGLLAAHDPDDDNRRVLAGIKSNLAPLPQALGYRLVDSPENGCARIEWLGVTEHSATDLLRQGGDDGEEGDELCSMLRLILDAAGGEITAADAAKRLRAFGAAPARATLHRARKRAGIESVKSDFGGGWVWRYAHQGSTRTAQDSEDSAPQGPGTFGIFVEPSSPDAVGEPAETVLIELDDWRVIGAQGVADRLVADHHLDPADALAAATAEYAKARKFHDPSSMYGRVIKSKTAACGHPLEMIHTSNGKCGGCIMRGITQ